jgi:hypothetical protein
MVAIALPSTNAPMPNAVKLAQHLGYTLNVLCGKSRALFRSQKAAF